VKFVEDIDGKIFIQNVVHDSTITDIVTIGNFEILPNKFYLNSVFKYYSSKR
jgi:hypothetical protein